MMETMRDHHTVKCSTYEKMITTLTKMSGHLNKAIEHNREAIEESRGVAVPETNKDTQEPELV